jgi:WD40 repeat protein
LPTFRLILWSAFCLFYGVAPVSAQLAGEQIKELPFKVLTRSIYLGGAVEDADIAPDGEHTAAAVRKCGIPGVSRTCTLDVEVWSSADATHVANRLLFSNVSDVNVAIRFSADGHTLVISDGQEKLRLWRMPDLTETSSIDLGLTNEDMRELQKEDRQERAQLFEEHPRMSQSAPRVLQIEASPCSPLVAAVIRIGAAEMIRIFDFTSGKLLRSWSFLDAVSYKGTPQLSWSQDGKRLAIALPSTRGLKHPGRTDPANLLIYDVMSGKLSAKFEAGGRVIFAGDYLIASTCRTPGTFFKPTLRIFDSKTGETIRTIGAEGTGVRDPIAISADGKVVLGFVGRVRTEMIWSDLTTVDVPFDARIRLWEMPAGNLIFASEDLPLIPRRASFRLNAAGNWVIAFDQSTKLLLLQLK